MKKYFVPLFEAFLKHEGDRLFIQITGMMTNWRVDGGCDVAGEVV